MTKRKEDFLHESDSSGADGTGKESTRKPETTTLIIGAERTGA